MSTDLRRPGRTYTVRQPCQEFGCTPRALRFYEDKGLPAPAREGLNRVYAPKDRARLDLYEVGDGGLQQNAKSLRKFREKVAALEHRRAELDQVIAELHAGIAALEQRLAERRPDLLRQAADDDQMLRRHFDG